MLGDIHLIRAMLFILEIGDAIHATGYNKRYVSSETQCSESMFAIMNAHKRQSTADLLSTYNTPLL